jgi:hypothetical protein
MMNFSIKKMNMHLLLAKLRTSGRNTRQNFAKIGNFKGSATSNNLVHSLTVLRSSIAK